STTRGGSISVQKLELPRRVVRKQKGRSGRSASASSKAEPVGRDYRRAQAPSSSAPSAQQRPLVSWWAREVEALLKRGFTDRGRMLEALRRSGGDVEKAELLLRESDGHVGEVEGWA
ncbi:unnamed protein product, partial [Amoebophrya sp. A120]